MTADELLERASSRLLTEYALLFEIKAEEADEQAQRDAAIAAAEDADRAAPAGPDDDADDEPDEPDDLSAEDWQRLIDEQRALIAMALAGSKVNG